MATSITLIRHAEKPDDEGKEFGVDEFGKPDPRGLTARGWQRAGALVRWIVPGRSGILTAPIPSPQAIFAVAPSPSSRRPLLTVQPLASLIGLEIDAAFASNQVSELLQQVHAVPGAVLICWRHTDMPEIAKRLCPDLVPAPQWNQNCFDQAWLFTSVGEAWTMRQVAQQLLPGDGGQASA
jgi:broad specificity phosphatase PhoE